MPGKIALVIASRGPCDWELHIHGLGLGAAATIGSFLLTPYFDFDADGNATLSVQSSVINIHPTSKMEYQPDIYSCHHVLRILRSSDCPIAMFARRRSWIITWQVVYFPGW